MADDCNPANNQAYIFLDESGNLDFGPDGTRYLLLTGVTLRRPFSMNRQLDNYLYERIEDGDNMEYFHCYNDRREVRRAVFGLICEHLGAMQIDRMIADKRALPTQMQDATLLYAEMLGGLTRAAVQSAGAGITEVIVITDTMPMKKRRRVMEKTIRNALSGMLDGIVSYSLMHHQSRTHYGLQVADCCCWAISRKWNRGDREWYDSIRSAVRHECMI